MPIRHRLADQVLIVRFRKSSVQNRESCAGSVPRAVASMTAVNGLTNGLRSGLTHLFGASSLTIGIFTWLTSKGSGCTPSIKSKTIATSSQQLNLWQLMQSIHVLRGIDS